MKTRHFILAILCLLLGSTTGFSQENAKDLGLNAITTETIQGQLEFLSSDWTMGRETGTEGAYIAADYIASMFKVFGLEPGGDQEQRRFGRSFRRGGPPPAPPGRTYFQNFALIESWAGETQEMSVVSEKGNSRTSIDFNYHTDFSINPGQTGMEAEVPVVFVGYGLKDDVKGYNDFKGLDLEGKIVIKLQGFPGQADPSSKTYEKFKPEERPQNQNDMRAYYARMMRGGGRNAWANELGVVGIIEVNPDRNPTMSWTTNVPDRTEGIPRSGVRKSLRVMGDELNQSVINFQVTQRVVNELIRGTGIDFDAIEKQIAATGKPASKELTGKYVRFKTTVNSRMVKVRNVVGVLKGKDTTNALVIGGHYDHLGERSGYIYNGADDNASGTVGVMTIAKAMVASGVQPEKTIVFCAWTGEEKGLIGSSYFTNNSYEWNILCNLNYDMISRNSRGEDQDKKISMNYTSSFPLFKELTEKHNEEYDLGMEIAFRGSERPGGGSDHAPFARKGIPIFYFMAGFPEEYHQPDDHVELVLWPKMLNIIKLGYLDIFELANMDWE